MGQISSESRTVPNSHKKNTSKTNSMIHKTSFSEICRVSIKMNSMYTLLSLCVAITETEFTCLNAGMLAYANACHCERCSHTVFVVNLCIVFIRVGSVPHLCT